MSLQPYSSMSGYGEEGAGPGPSSSLQCPAPASKKAQQQASQQQSHQQLQCANDPLRTYKVFLSGALSGAISRTATAPIDRLKMILQTHDAAKGLSLRQGWQQMLAEGSLKSMFRGNGANVVKIAPETALKLTLNDSIRSLVAADPEHVRVRERMLSGGIAGAIAQGLLYPLDTIRTRLAVSPPGTYWGILHAAYRIRRDEGVGAFYRGLTPSMIGILPFAGVDIALFEVLMGHLYERHDGRPPHMAIVAAGMVSSSIAQVVSYPLALVRTRLQAQSGRSHSHVHRHRPAPAAAAAHGPTHGTVLHTAAHGSAANAATHGSTGSHAASHKGHVGHGEVPELKYKGMVDVFRKTIAREGVRGLYKGLLPNLLKMAPAAGIGWYVFEETKVALGVDRRT